MKKKSLYFVCKFFAHLLGFGISNFVTPTFGWVLNSCMIDIYFLEDEAIVLSKWKCIYSK
jgi:hypothetical protein